MQDISISFSYRSIEKSISISISITSITNPVTIGIFLPRIWPIDAVILTAVFARTAQFSVWEAIKVRVWSTVLTLTSKANRTLESSKQVLFITFNSVESFRALDIQVVRLECRTRHLPGGVCTLVHHQYSQQGKNRFCYQQYWCTEH